MNITRRIVFHAGHMLKDDTSKCFHPHGHEYVLECTLGGAIQQEGAESGMVMNFGNLKAIMMERVHDVFDHKFIIDNADPRCGDFVNAVGRDGVVFVDFPPTAENLVLHFAKLINIGIRDISLVPAPMLRVVHIKLQETLNCWAEASF